MEKLAIDILNAVIDEMMHYNLHSAERLQESYSVCERAIIKVLEER